VYVCKINVYTTSPALVVGLRRKRNEAGATLPNRLIITQHPAEALSRVPRPVSAITPHGARNRHLRHPLYSVAADPSVLPTHLPVGSYMLCRFLLDSEKSRKFHDTNPKSLIIFYDALPFTITQSLRVIR
jgi:hypothetical protein